MEKWRGNHVWVWQPWEIMNGDVDAMIRKLKEMGITGVLLKYSDGNLVGDPVSQQFMDTFKQLAPKLKAAGFTVGGWTYQYLTDVDGEVDALRQAVEAGAEWIVLDGEAEVKGKNDLVTEYGRKVRAMFPDLQIGFSSFAIADYHQEVPFAEYASFCDVMMPQIYWATIGRWSVDDCFALSVQSYAKFGKPIAPTGQAYDEPDQGVVTSEQDMIRFAKLCEGSGFTHVSWWDMQHFNSVHEAAIKTTCVPIPAPRPPQTDDVPAWAAEAVAWCRQHGIMSGTDQGFEPNRPPTRAELAVALFNTFHQKKN